MKLKKPAYILTDIEGTTTSISFVVDKLFPYFRENIQCLLELESQEAVRNAFMETIELAKEEDGIEISTSAEIIETLHRWSVEDRKITPLKTVQGILWQKGYEAGELKGHVYEDVAPAMKKWKNQGIGLGVFSSGSVAAQKLIFGYSISGDLRPYFSNYFDTKTGGKRNAETYLKIAQILDIDPSEILFLSDIYEELEAANEAGFQVLQIVRGEVNANWKQQVADFYNINFKE